MARAAAACSAAPAAARAGPAAGGGGGEGGGRGLAAVLQQGEGPLHARPLLRPEVVAVHPAGVRLGARRLQVEPLGVRGVVSVPRQLLAVLARVAAAALAAAAADLAGGLLLGAELEEAECVLGAEEAGHHGHDGAERGADVGGPHEVVEPVLADVLLVGLAEEAAPLPHLQHQQVDQVDHGDHQRHQQQPLRLLHGQLAEAAEHDRHDPTEHVLKTKQI